MKITDIKVEYKLKINDEELGIGITHPESSLNNLEDLFKLAGKLAAEAFQKGVSMYKNNHDKRPN